jgi:hypothetical protein
MFLLHGDKFLSDVLADGIHEIFVAMYFYITLHF